MKAIIAILRSIGLFLLGYAIPEAFKANYKKSTIILFISISCLIIVYILQQIKLYQITGEM